MSTIFFIEKYFGGEITEIIPQGKVPSPDFKVKFDKSEFLIEAKAQSGQQHGANHPMHTGPTLFDPKAEADLQSWLFEKKISSRNGRAMEPMAIAAEKKGADILICQTDYIATKVDPLSQISVPCPQNRVIEKITLHGSPGKPMKVWFFQATFPCENQLSKLKEIWLCNLCSDDYKFVALSQNNAILKNYLKNES